LEFSHNDNCIARFERVVLTPTVCKYEYELEASEKVVPCVKISGN
jgi:hypothetical protein